MSLSIAVPVLKVVSPGVWEVDIRSEDLSALGTPLFTGGPRSILFFTRAPTSIEANEIRVNPIGILVAAASAQETLPALAIDLSCAEEQESQAPMADRPHGSPLVSPVNRDAEFFSSLGDQPEDLGLLARSVVQFARALAPTGYLELAGSSGRWVERPNNFWSIKVQPRARSISVTVAGSVADHTQFPDIVLKQDRGSYSRFTMASQGQLSSACRLIREAHARSWRR